MQPHLEILELKDESNGWMLARLAYRDRLVPPFEFPKSVMYEEFPDEASFLAYLTRQAETLQQEYAA